MKLKLIFGIIIYLICSHLEAQEKLLEQRLLGKWKFTHAIDNQGNKVNRFKNKKKIKASDIVLKGNGTFRKNIFSDLSNKGKWKLISKDEIEFQMVFKKNDNEAATRYALRSKYNKKWGKDKTENYVYTWIDQIVYLTNTEIKIYLYEDFYGIYKKK